jgi:hypothetical protein
VSSSVLSRARVYLRDWRGVERIYWHWEQIYRPACVCDVISGVEWQVPSGCIELDYGVWYMEMALKCMDLVALTIRLLSWRGAGNAIRSHFQKGYGCDEMSFLLIIANT